MMLGKVNKSEVGKGCIDERKTYTCELKKVIVCEFVVQGRPERKRRQDRSKIRNSFKINVIKNRERQAKGRSRW